MRGKQSVDFSKLLQSFVLTVQWCVPRYVRRIIQRDCDATCYIVFLVKLFKYCLCTVEREGRTKELQASICRQMLNFAHHSKEEGQRGLSDKTSAVLQQEEMSMLVLLPEITSILRGLGDPTMKTYLVAVLVEFTYYQTRMKNELMKQGGAAVVASFLSSQNSDLIRQSCALLVNWSVVAHEFAVVSREPSCLDSYICVSVSCQLRTAISRANHPIIRMHPRSASAGPGTPLPAVFPFNSRVN